ncbi:hypothetical protein H0G72_03535 [Liberibacter sp. Z1]|nr:hypothetical protein [Candidatus Liberibacter sp.]
MQSSPANVKIEADVLDCKKLAKQWDVSSVESLYADVKLYLWKKIGIRLTGKVYAKLTQVCVITLEPVISEIEESLGCLFVQDLRHINDSPNKALIEAQGPDILTFSGDGVIDIGLAVSELAAVAINPYPKKKGVAFSGWCEDVLEDKKVFPFKALEE